MLRQTPTLRPRWLLAAATILLVTITFSVVTRTALALITGGEGNAAINDPGWPKGGAIIFNNPARIACWEGPPFGGGQWHSECRGDAKAFNAVIADFAKLDAKSKRLVIHDGVGHSFWLNPNRAKGADAAIDWVFIVWQPTKWESLRRLPRELNPTAGIDADEGPPAQLDVYTGGNIRWADLVVPEGTEISDERLGAHGFTLDDGVVLEGTVVDLADNQPIAATVRLQRVEPQPKGGYTIVASTVADDKGRWALKKMPAGSHRVVIETANYVPRVAAYASFDGQPCWHSYNVGLSKPAPVAGRITDDVGRPLEGVEVHFTNLGSDTSGRYELSDESVANTDADGRFIASQVPVGDATIRLRKVGYTRPGLAQPITIPASDIVLKMIKATRVSVTVDFGHADRPAEYIVEMEPEGGAAVGKWGGSSKTDANNQVAFEGVPPGRYVLHGKPNPSRPDQQSKPLTIDVKGVTMNATLKAR